jgi:hypothetical protein
MSRSGQSQTVPDLPRQLGLPSLPLGTIKGSHLQPRDKVYLGFLSRKSWDLGGRELETEEES